MSRKWDIGQEAKKLDQKSIRERMRLEKKTYLKMLAFVFVYLTIMLYLYLIL